MLRGTGNVRGRGTLTTSAASRFLANAVLAGASVAAAVLAFSPASCGESQPGLLPNEDGGPPTTGVALSGCTTPSAGCACNQEGMSVACGQVRQRQGDYVFCDMGQRKCSGGVWGACVGDTLVTQALPTSGSGLHLENLGTQEDGGIVCDPNMSLIVSDNSGGIDAGPGFAQAPDGGGLSLLVTMGSGIGCAVNPVVTPTPQNIVVTSISPTLTTNPPNLTYTATCGAGGAVLSPSWTLSDYDIGTITPNMAGLGVFTVYTPVATTETVTATSATFSGTAIANVTVNVNQMPASGPCAAASFVPSVATDTNLTVLYPYSQTVFPLGLAAPTVQWDDKSTPSTCVKISLRYPPKPATQTFTWSTVIDTHAGDPNGSVITAPYTQAPTYTIPQYAWSGFDRSSAGNGAEIAIQRMTTIAGVLTPLAEETVPVTFATAPLNGTVYYVQYQRNVTNANASDSNVTNITTPYNIGAVCPVGNGTHVSSQGSQVYAVNPSAAGTPVDPFNGTAGCPVCHSLSGNGKTFISVDHGIGIWPASSGTVKVGYCAIGAGGVFGSCNDVPDWTGVVGSNNGDWNSRGFSYNAITYDGRYNIQASEFWGNGNDTPLVASPTTTQNNVLTGTTTLADGGTGNNAAWDVYDNLSGTPTNVTASFTGLGSTGMLTPTFSPDSTKLAYVNADSGPGGATGWKKGLSVMTFNEAAKSFSNPTVVVNNWNGGAGTGNPIKWPFFEYDSRSLLFVETTPQEYCVSGTNDVHDENNPTAVGCYQSSYGNMSPTTRSYWPGKIRSADATMLNAAVDLTNLDNGQYGEVVGSLPARTDNGAKYDQNKAYQPTALPFASGGYRWVIFTSQRAYGNQVNPYDYVHGTATTPSCAVGQLWVAALNDATSAATDRSHPAFWLPNQLYATLNSNHYVNERGYLVPAACAPTGSSASSVCSTNSDCCAGNCRIDLPAASPPTRHCQTASGTCSQAGNSCAVNSDCCNGANCVNGSCAAPPTYPPQTFTRLYTGTCNPGNEVVWHLFEWHAAVPGNATIAFSVQTSQGQGADAGALVPAMPIGIASATNANQNPPPAALDVSQDVDTTLRSQGLVSGSSLLVTMVFNPTTPGDLATPVLYDWDMTFDCVASE
jgi:hypothetical protein